MERVEVNGVELEFEVRGTGEPVLLIDMLIADCFVPLLTEPSLANRYQLIRYHKRGWRGSTHAAAGEHRGPRRRCCDPARRARCRARSHRGALDRRVDRCPTRSRLPRQGAHAPLLEPTLVSLPHGQAFLQSAGPVFDAYERGDHAAAFAMFAATASGLDWAECQALLEERIPGAVAQSIRDADTFFGIELPSLLVWAFGPEQAAAIQQPTLSLLGGETQPLWVEIADFLGSWVPGIEKCTVDGVGHLLQIQRPAPVAQAIAEFLGRNHSRGDQHRI